MKKIIIVVVIAIIVVAGAVFALTRTNTMDMTNMQSGSASQDSTAVETSSVTIKGYAFEPAMIKVKAGTKVTWTNEDTVKHNVVTEDGAPESISGNLIGKGETYSHTFTKAGTYDYYCQPHPYMKGQVIVTN